MSQAIKTFETIDNNSKISLKGNLSYVLKKCMFMFIKYLNCDKCCTLQLGIIV